MRPTDAPRPPFRAVTFFTILRSPPVSHRNLRQQSGVVLLSGSLFLLPQGLGCVLEYYSESLTGFEVFDALVDGLGLRRAPGPAGSRRRTNSGGTEPDVTVDTPVGASGVGGSDRGKRRHPRSTNRWVPSCTLVGETDQGRRSENQDLWPLRSLGLGREIDPGVGRGPSPRSGD